MPKVFWLTGLPSSGKTTLGVALTAAIDGPVKHLDGDETRKGLCSDLGFSARDRAENIRRIAWTAKALYEAGVSVVCSYISPYAAARQFVRSLFPPDDFVLIYLSTSATECARRDPKGLWADAKAGLIKGFTGVDDPYEEPEDPEVISLTNLPAEDLADFILYTYKIADETTHPITSLFIGRWQPPHPGHIKLIRTALALGNRVLIGIRDIPANESNPLSVSERIVKFDDIFTEEEFQRIRYVVLPESDGGLEVCHGRTVGWGIREIRLDEQTEAISATEIRKRIVT